MPRQSGMPQCRDERMRLPEHDSIGLLVNVESQHRKAASRAVGAGRDTTQVARQLLSPADCCHPPTAVTRRLLSPADCDYFTLPPGGSRSQPRGGPQHPCASGPPIDVEVTQQTVRKASPSAARQNAERDADASGLTALSGCGCESAASGNVTSNGRKHDAGRLATNSRMAVEAGPRRRADGQTSSTRFVLAESRIVSAATRLRPSHRLLSASLERSSWQQPQRRNLVALFVTRHSKNSNRTSTR